MPVDIRVDLYEPEDIKEGLRKYLERIDVPIHVEDRREQGGDYVIMGDEIEYWIERKTITDMISSILRNVYENGKPKSTGRSRRLFTQLLKLKGENRVPILLIEGELHNIAESKRHMIIGVEEWCIRKEIFVIHTCSKADTIYAIYNLAKKMVPFEK